MKDELFNAVRVTPSTKIRFKCTGCAECCRHVKESVPVNSLDVFYLTKYLRDTGLDICCTDEFLAQFATVALLDDCGYFMYFLKSVGEDDSCIFLNENRCSVQPAKPMACRLYPFMVNTNGSGGFRYLYSREREHHFCGPVVETRLDEEILPAGSPCIHAGGFCRCSSNCQTAQKHPRTEKGRSTLSLP